MSSLPNPNHLSTTPNDKISNHLAVNGGGAAAGNNNTRFHRHRRSAAISGDFDSMGLGLFSPNAQFNNNLHSQSKSISSIKDDELDKHFNFNNDEDFSKGTQDFLFPTYRQDKNLDNLMISTPPRYFNSPKKNLNSPIRLNQKRSFSQGHSKSQSQGLNTPKTKFFLTEETTVNNDNVPDAVIDLDEVLNANLHIGGYSGNNNGRKHDDTFSDDESLASPFLRPVSSPYAFSPSVSLPNATTLFQQPIQENMNDDMEEQDEIDSQIDNPDQLVLTGHDNSESRSVSPKVSDPELDMELEPTDSQLESQACVNDDPELFSNPPNINTDFYSHSSANSSSSSLKNRLIEKTFSNSSKDSNNSTVIQGSINSNGTPKRSGAKSSRYQSFYDQSYKVSNALKISSAESLTLSKPSSPQQSHLSLSQQSQPHSQLSLQSQAHNGHLHSNNMKMFKDSSNTTRCLAHSSSLPSLKSQISIAKYQRYGDPRLKYAEINKLSPPPAISSTNTGVSNNNTSVNTTNISGSPSTSQSNYTVGNKSPTPISGTNYGAGMTCSPVRKDLPRFVQKENKIELNSPSSLKQVSNSPVSIISDAGSTTISTNGTIMSTDHSSFTSQHDKSLVSNSTLQANSQLSSGSITSTVNLPNYQYKDQIVAPSIVVNNGNLSPPNSTNSTFKLDDLETVQNTPILSQESNPSSSNSSSVLNSPTLNSKTNGSSSPRKSPRRPLTPNEQKLFKETAIPPFRDKRKGKKSLGSSSSSINIPESNAVTNNRGKSSGGDSKENLMFPPPKPNSESHGHLKSSPIRKRNLHVKSKSFSVVLHDLSPKLSRTSTFDDSSSIKLTKSTRLMGWFRRK